MRVAASADLIDDREYAAPPALVFEAWTKAEHFARWFAPDNVEVPLCEIDARPGGVIRFQHRWPEGQLVSIMRMSPEDAAAVACVLDQLERCEQTIDLVAGSVLPALARTPAPAIVAPGWKPIKG